MSDNNGLNISRRRALAGIGAIGVASAGAGVGTSAYFSDTESFENNSITAGELDLKVDWQQTYNGPNPMSETGAVEEHPVNAYPDTMMSGESYGDGLQDLNDVRYSGAGELDPVFNAADVPACCDCEEGEYYVTYGGETYCIEPLSGDNPEDAYDKTGVRSENTDFQDDRRSTVFLWEDTSGDGEGNVYLFIVNDRIETDEGGTATYRIEGAPSARWLSGDWVVEDDDRGDSDDDYEDPDSSDEVAVGNWVWGGPNTDGGVLGPVNNNGSQGDFALRLTPELNKLAAKHDPAEDGDFSWFDYDSDWGALTTLAVLDGDAGTSITLEDGIPESGEGVDQITIHSSCGIESGANLPSDVFASQYYPEQSHLVELDDVKPGDSGEITFSLHLCDNPGYIWFKAGNFSESGGALTEPEQVAMNGSDQSSVEESDDTGDLAEYVNVTLWYDADCDNEFDDDDEMSIYDGTLAGLMGKLGVESGAAEGDDGFEGMLPLDADRTTDGKECFPPEEGFCVGFEWEVSTEVGNIIQGDSASFDLGFYTEQCRHNDDAIGNDSNSSTNETAPS